MNWDQRFCQHNATASLTMVMCLLQTMNTFILLFLSRVICQEASFCVGNFHESSRLNEVILLVLPSMCHHFAGVRADEITF